MGAGALGRGLRLPGQLAGQLGALGKMALVMVIGIPFLWEVILPLQI